MKSDNKLDWVDRILAWKKEGKTFKEVQDLVEKNGVTTSWDTKPSKGRLSAVYYEMDRSGKKVKTPPPMTIKVPAPKQNKFTVIVCESADGVAEILRKLA